MTMNTFVYTLQELIAVLWRIVNDGTPTQKTALGKIINHRGWVQWSDS